MSEATVIQHTHGEPATVASLRDDLLALGLRPGSTVLVHSSLSALGWVCGGPIAVIMALEEVLGRHGTLAMPTHTAHLSDPELWRSPTVPERWVETIRASLPPFDPRSTPSRGMGIIPETFRSMPGVLRSNHPHDSFAARGDDAITLTAAHGFDDGLGERSPLARLYEQDGWVLLLGVGHESNTSLHLAEYRADYPDKRQIRNGAACLVDRQRRWLALQHLEYRVSDFNRIGAAFGTESRTSRSGSVGEAPTLLMRQRELVNYAVRWMERYRR